jgi:hypothetical protein
MKYYKASVNVNLNWSKFNSLRANLVIQPILRLILYKLQSPSHRVTEDHLVHSLKFGLI